MTDSHRSIGEVLSFLQEEFPDVTISKIRFLESQGLVAPERTPSGYRKFYEGDVERLRWILRQQKDNYLPLKVIKNRLAQLEEHEAPDQAEFELEAVAESEPDEEAAESPDATLEVPTAATEDDKPDARSGGTSGAALSLAELAAAAGLDEKTLTDLQGYGLLPAPKAVGDQELYDESALVLARLARGFMRHGVEPRHLRMYKTYAEREAGFVQQLVNPILKQKNPEARKQARETVGELARLGGGLRAALLRQALKGAFDE